jgi:hypothetical protein
MPRPLVAILKACWAALAWVLFLSGVIGCDDGPHRDRGAFLSDTDSGNVDVGADGGVDTGAWRGTFVWFRKTTHPDFGNPSFINFSIDASGNVEPGVGPATPEEIARFAELATRPETFAAFMSNERCEPQFGLADAHVDYTLKLEDQAAYSREDGCPGIAPIVQAAAALQQAVAARHAEAGAAK